MKKILVKLLALINKYNAIEASMKRAEYFVNVSYNALGIFEKVKIKKFYKILLVLVLNRSF